MLRLTNIARHSRVYSSMEVLSDQSFQVIVIPLLLTGIAQGFYLLGKRGKPNVNDFVSLPYSLGMASIAINSVFAIAQPEEIRVFYAWLIVLFFALIIVAFSHRYISTSSWIVNIGCSAFGIFLVSATIFIWR